MFEAKAIVPMHTNEYIKEYYSAKFPRQVQQQTDPVQIITHYIIHISGGYQGEWKPIAELLPLRV